jgi:Xaa-Pro dipeptidase
MTANSYAEHVRERQRRAETALAASLYDAMVIQSGTPFTYFADDMDAPFHPTPHFASWVPLRGPHHLLLVRPGARPKLVRVHPEDYWYEQAPLGSPYWRDAFDFEEVPDAAAAWKRLDLSERTAYVGDAPEEAEAAGIAEVAIQPPALLARLDWDRSYKTAYEVACIEEATRQAARGHLAAKAAFERGASELAIHHAYVQATDCVDEDLPYPTIIALDEKGATLHYHAKRTKGDGRVLLIDCGATHAGYASDITRTWTRDGCDALFRELVGGMERLQQELCAAVRPGLAYPDLHHQAHLKVADLLHETGLIRAGGEDAVVRGLTQPFFPHGLGHFLGIQTHDVSGHQKAPEGGTVPPPAAHPYLRTTRTIEEHQVFTIEPGLYFIEMLLRPHRTGPERDAFDWRTIDRLAPCGGIRIEDNVVVTARGHRNLTRPHLP